ncbi:hypothetical protein E3T49_13185 [Cryobacterium cryoconiti]|uniref:Uncharacterized protein n=2 Tax=Cryobacterium cryoconiti TaxID=1259239 RepID=A0A4Y8JU95_9MICO|nr:hypothetical protein E3T49_13185 [Cryobacterium cryoconiti]
MKSYAETVAPCPHWGDENITADQVIRAALVNAQEQFERMHASMRADMTMERGTAAYESALRQTLVYTTNFITHSIVADLFNTIQRLALDEADAIASTFVARSESGDYYPEAIWDWMTASGIDPERIRTETIAAIAAEKSK